MEPSLLPLSGESLNEKTANMSDEARCDVSVRGFWSAGQVAFLDIRIFNPNAARYANQSLKKCYESNEKEKKRNYNERVREIDHGTFTPIVMSATGGMGRESSMFYKRLAEVICERRFQPYAVVASWIQRKLSFSLIRSLGMCLRGIRSVSSSKLLVESAASKDIVSSEVTSRINSLDC